MIAYLRGAILSNVNGRAVISIGQIGYEVRVGPHFVPIGTETELHCWHVHNETEDLLFGFDTAAERELAILVAETPKIGPKRAHQFVTTVGLEPIMRAVQSDSTSGIKVKGLGPDLLQGIIKTLKDKGSFDAGDSTVTAVRLGLGKLGMEAHKYDVQLARLRRDHPTATPGELIGLVLRDLRGAA